MPRKEAKKEMSAYNIRVKEEWIKSTANLPPHMKTIINEKVENIRERPYDTEALKAELDGLWSYNKLSTDSRIIYAICEDCRKRKLVAMNNCVDCKEMNNKTVMLWVFGGHSIYDILKRERSKAWKKAMKQIRRERG
jgi:mRNA-degrading endonuclease RelE of RelBE toxin-antitoxin system